MPRFFRPLLFLTGAVALLLVAGCDSSGGDGGQATPTVQFGTAGLSLLEAQTPTLQLPVTISNAPDRPVTVDVLFAGGASDGFSLDDLGITDPVDSLAYYDADGNLTAYIVDRVTFDANAEDGTTKTAEFDITDDEIEDEEVGVFALQQAHSAGGGAVEVGDPGDLSVTVQAEGTVTFLSEDFSDGDINPFSAFSVTSGGIKWGTATNGGVPSSPYAYINGFSGSEPSDDWLISPAFDFSATTDETLSFISGFGYNGPPIMVKVSTDYSGEGNPEDATWTDITDRATLPTESDKDGTFTPLLPSGDVDLSDFDGEAVYVAFQYVSGSTASASAGWEVDDVVITGRGAAGGGAAGGQ